MKKDKINIGSCDFSKDGWYTLDKLCSHYSSRQNTIDIDHNLMSKNNIPLSDNSIKVAYSSHTIEHISDEYVQHLFDEVYRILEPGGMFRVTCPDIDRCYQAYMNDDREYIGNWLLNPVGKEKFKSHGLGEQFLFIFSSYLSPYRTHVTTSDLGQIKKYTEEEINKVFTENTKTDALDFFTKECQEHAKSIQGNYPGEHISWWDYDKIKIFMECAGFKNVEKEHFNRSRSFELIGFDHLNTDNNKCLNYTVFVEAQK
jgi:predicted SAM-dependent methyltransferase